jgi:hypothetical protein
MERQMTITEIRESRPKILEPKVLPHLQDGLRKIIDFTDEENCQALYVHIKKFLAHVCQNYDDVILTLASTKTDGKTLEDWRSWYIDVIKQVLTATLERFSDLVVKKEPHTVNFKDLISCTVANRYRGKLSECYQYAHEDFIERAGLNPRSKRFQQKRKGQTHKPWLGIYIPCAC